MLAKKLISTGIGLSVAMLLIISTALVAATLTDARQSSVPLKVTAVRALGIP
jgi:hypothetical protein